MKVIDPSGYENYVLKREDKDGRPELIIAHASFMVSHHSPTSLLQRAANGISEQLEHEDLRARAVGDQTTGAPVLATTTGDRGGTTKGTRKRQRAITTVTTATVLHWWNSEDGADGTGPDSTSWSMSCGPPTRLVTNNRRRTMVDEERKADSVLGWS
ncbi:hypothetical protein C6341_g223 [Phytophthora cactorum]|nr:hypothetical protein C6341_g223 [Phytophthora cactorum]